MPTELLPQHIITRFSDELGDKIRAALAETRQHLADEGVQYSDLDVFIMFERVMITHYIDFAYECGDFKARQRGKAVGDAFFELFSRQNGLD